MDEQPRKSPELSPEVGSEVPGSRWITMPAVGDLLGLSERAARDWVKRHDLPTRGTRPVRVSEQATLAAMAEEERVARKPPEVSPEPPGSVPEAPGSSEPIEAAYRVAGEAAAEVALVPLATMVEELRGLAAELQEMSRRNEALALEVGQLRERQIGHTDQLAAKDAALGAKDETIAELRRRAEQAERALAEAEAVRAALATVTADERDSQGAALDDATARAEGAEAWRGRMNAAAVTRVGEWASGGLADTPTGEEPPAGFWARVRRFFGGG